ncbi:MAG: signal peptidase I [Lactobacillales bacterium]|nr:signal peptidase I [Lactobacillales bacterium]
MKNFIKELIPYVIIIVVVVLIRMFIVTPVQVDGNSMYPTLKDNEILLLKKYDQKYKRFDIVVLNYNNSKLIKRIIGLPGEHIEYKDNKLYVNGKYVKERFKRNTETSDFEIDKKIPKGYYFVMGDNRDNSTDSRMIGFISKNDLEGVSDIALFPFDRFGSVK